MDPTGVGPIIERSFLDVALGCRYLNKVSLRWSKVTRLSGSIRMNLSELRSEQKNLRRIEDPDQKDNKRSRGTVRATGIAASQIEAQHMFANDKKRIVTISKGASDNTE